MFPDEIARSAAGCNSSIKARSARSAESETTSGPSEKPAQVDWSVIQAGMPNPLPDGDSQTTQSPSTQCTLRKTLKLTPNRYDHR
jgi:hypothetical protein